MAWSRRCSTAWISFFARVRERTSCSRRARRRRKIRQRSSGIHTASSSPAHNNLASARASSLSVFARALEIPVSSGETTTTRFTYGSRILATSQQDPVTSNATRSDTSRLCAKTLIPSGVAGTRPAERTSPSSQIATSQNSRCTSKPTARPTHLTSPILTSTNRVITNGRTSGTTTQTDTSSKLNPGKSQRRPERTARARSPSIKTAYPSAFSQRGPCPGSAELRHNPGRTSHPQFHASISGRRLLVAVKRCLVLGPEQAAALFWQSEPGWCGCRELRRRGGRGWLRGGRGHRLRLPGDADSPEDHFCRQQDAARCEPGG